MNKLILHTTLFSSLLCASALLQAEEGILAITTDPPNAEIYVDGQLKTNLTPVVLLHLPAGKHLIEAKKDNQSAKLEVLISDNVVVHNKMVLVRDKVFRDQLVANITVAEGIKDFEDFKKLTTENKLLCTTCHQQDKKVIGPSYNAVALFYKDKADAAALLEKRILAGGSYVWGRAMMTPNPTAEDQVGVLVKWILSLNPEGDAKAKAEAEIAEAEAKNKKFKLW